MIKYEFVTTKGRSENTGIEQSLIEADVICPKPIRAIPCGMTVSYVYVFHDKLKQWESNFHGTGIQFILCHRSTFTNSFLVRRKHMVIAKGNKRLRMMLNDKRYTYRWWLFWHIALSKRKLTRSWTSRDEKILDYCVRIECLGNSNWWLPQ